MESIGWTSRVILASLVLVVRCRMECSLGLIILRKLDFPVSYSQESIEVNRCVQINMSSHLVFTYIWIFLWAGIYFFLMIMLFTIFS